jgi:hypothetical protein
MKRKGCVEEDTVASFNSLYHNGINLCTLGKNTEPSVTIYFVMYQSRELVKLIFELHVS